MDVLDLKLLHTFLVLSQTLSFRAAAARLNTTQPAVSNRLRRLERMLGVRLLERSTRSCQLTARGRILVSDAERLAAAISELRQNIAAADAVGGLLKLGVVETIALTWLPDLVMEVSRRFPRLRLQIDVDLSLNLVRSLQSRDLDLACVVAPAAVPGISSEPLSVLEMAWVARADFPIMSDLLTPDSICDYPVIFHDGSRHASTVDQWLGLAKKAPRCFIGCNDLATIIKLTLGGAGLSLVPVAAVANEIASGQLKFLPTRDLMPPNPFVIAYPRSTIGRPFRGIVELIKETVAHHAMKNMSGSPVFARAHKRATALRIVRRKAVRASS